ncbi:MAG: hypothetical protein AABZ08_10200 [Planctomycetota bacterium]
MPTPYRESTPEHTERDKQIELVLVGLRDIMTIAIGTSRPFGRTSLFIKYFQEVRVWDELCIHDFLFVVKDTFGVDHQHNGWRSVFGLDITDTASWCREVQDRLSFNDIAEFILQNDPFIHSAEGVTTSSHSKADDALQLIIRIVHSILPGIESIEPNTLISSRLRGRHLRQLWKQIRWRSCNRIPALKSTVRWRVFEWFGGKTLLMAAITVVALLFFRFDETRYMAFFIQCLLILLIVCGTWFSVGLLLLLLTPIVGHRDCGLPSGITTLGDLARLIANE